MNRFSEIERMNKLKGFLSPQIAKWWSPTGEIAGKPPRGISRSCSATSRLYRIYRNAEPEDIYTILQEYYCCLGKSIDRFEGT